MKTVLPHPARGENRNAARRAPAGPVRPRTARRTDWRADGAPGGSAGSPATAFTHPAPTTPVAVRP
ncbi:MULTISPECIES: hypothetical protein [Actinosynnema]|uniref:hypothetical protein n=1 Tax=Actinosynnema TaxID=40566 RepID=UPI0020A2F242|nr:hypothetical protein [Actinosynnema pretiosum]MCP2095376.1 hypothetical protein [Actinosynnema pretiosum]